MKGGRLFLVYLIFSVIPATRLFSIKAALLRWAGAKIGANVRIVSSARFYVGGQLSVGDDTWIGHEVLVVGGAADVTIGARVDLAPRVTLITGTHELYSVPGRAAGAGYSLPIDIQDGVWIGASATVLGGVTVHECAVVAAGALVRYDIQAFNVVGGVPARIISRSNK